MREFCELFQGIEDPRRSNATRHDLHDRPALSIARMYRSKMSMRSKFLHASWSYDFLLDMIRATRRRM